MPNCTTEERAFLDKLKESFIQYRDEEPWDEGDQPSEYYIDDMLFTLGLDGQGDDWPDFRLELLNVLNSWDKKES